MQTSMFKKGKIILIDEVDGIAGRQDFGGVGEIVKCIKESNQRIVLTANDPWDKKLNELRKNVNILELNKLNYVSVANYLNEISKKEKLKVDDTIIKKIAVSVKGDLRAAINDLECLSNDKCEINTLDIDVIGEREKEERIFEFLRLLFKTKDLAACSETFDKVNLNLEEIFLWIEENLPLEYKNPEELAKAYDYLSKYDIFNGRIRRKQHWRFIVYQKAFLSNGIALSKNSDNKGFVGYKRTSRILKLWKAKITFAKRDVIALKLAKEMHISKRKALRDFLPYMPFLLRDIKVREELELDNKDLKILNAVQ